MEGTRYNDARCARAYGQKYLRTVGESPEASMPPIAYPEDNQCCRSDTLCRVIRCHRRAERGTIKLAAHGRQSERPLRECGSSET